MDADQGFFYKANHADFQPILIWRDDNVSGGAHSGDKNALSVIVWDGTTRDWISTPTDSLNDTNWHNISVTLDPTNNLMNVYIDGITQSVSGYTMNSNGVSVGTKVVTLGGPLLNSVDLNGAMDDVRIYNTALSASDAALLATSYSQFNPVWNSGTATFNAGQHVTLNGTLTATSSGNALTIATGQGFVNNAGASALNTPSGAG
ncbi:MAG: LamG domain-containing protein [Alphaproteobacteria bacterium]|nr:LamG domain-containing protein [Alphaproteobacteria bacterium]